MTVLKRGREETSRQAADSLHGRYNLSGGQARNVIAVTHAYEYRAAFSIRKSGQQVRKNRAWRRRRLELHSRRLATFDQLKRPAFCHLDWQGPPCSSVATRLPFSPADKRDDGGQPQSSTEMDATPLVGLSGLQMTRGV